MGKALSKLTMAFRWAARPSEHLWCYAINTIFFNNKRHNDAT